MHRSGLRPMAIAAAAGGDQMPIEPGEHEVSAAIDATFALELTWSGPGTAARRARYQPDGPLEPGEDPMNAWWLKPGAGG